MSETKIPGTKSCHRVISNECRENKGAEGAFHEAVSDARKVYDNCVEGLEGSKFNAHLVLVIEKLP